LAAQLARPEHGTWDLAPATIYRFLRWVGMQTRWRRLAVLEVHSAQTAGLLIERTRRALARAQRRRPPHLAAEQPADVICLDTFYIGKLKGVGKVWQYTACDAACSYAIAEVATEFSAEAAVRFLTARVLSAYRAAGWPVRRVLTDQGSEYREAFDRATAARGIRHTRTRPRHAWTNGFVERPQGSILTELWRVEFRRRFFTHVRFLQAALDRYLARVLQPPPAALRLPHQRSVTGRDFLGRGLEGKACLPLVCYVKATLGLLPKPGLLPHNLGPH
jgi:transposase InsO family protein